MPEQIPILYTGKNVARPDFKSMTKSIQNSFAQARNRKQQQAQFDSLQNERATKEFLKNLDIDEVKSTNEGLTIQGYRAYKDLEDQLTSLLKENGGRVDVQDQVAARRLSTDANQEVAQINESSKNWSLDKMAALKNPDLYDLEKAKGVIFNYDGKEPYSESRLDQVYRDMSIEEVRDRNFQKMRDPDSFRTTAMVGGKEINGEQEYDDAYFNKVIDEQGNTKIVPDYAAQVGFLQARTADEGKVGVLFERAYDDQFNKASKQDQELYKAKARKFTGREENAHYLYELDTADGKYFESGEFEAEKVAKPKGAQKKTIKVHSGTGNFSDTPVTLSKVNGAVVTENGKASTVDIVKGKNKILITNVEYTTNPSTGQEEWMAFGQYENKEGKGFKVETDSEGKVTGFSSGGDATQVQFAVPYNNVKEPLERNYNFEGMRNFKAPARSIKKKKAY